MAIDFMGSEDIEFESVGPITGDATAGKFDAAFVRGAVRVNGSSKARVRLPAARTDFWIHARLRGNAGNWPGWQGPLMKLTDSGGNTLWRLGMLNGVAQLDLWNGSSWTRKSLGAGPSDGVTHTFDLRLTIDDTVGAFEGWVNGAKVDEFTGDTSPGSGAGVAYIDLGNVHEGGAGTNEDAFWSEVLVISGGERTVGWRVGTMAPNGDGAHSDGSGTSAEVDEVAESGDLISLTAAGQMRSVTLTNPPAAPSGLVRRGVQVTAKARRGATGPQTMEVGVRVDGTTYLSGTKALTETLARVSHTWETSPATDALWTGTELDGAEAVVKATA